MIAISADFDSFLSTIRLLAPGRWADMKKWFCSIAGLSFALAGCSAAFAQIAAVPPPNMAADRPQNPRIRPSRQLRLHQEFRLHTKQHQSEHQGRRCQTTPFLFSSSATIRRQSQFPCGIFSSPAAAPRRLGSRKLACSDLLDGLGGKPQVRRLCGRHD